MPPHAAPSLQADAFALLLDHLGIDRAAVLGFSAGGPPAIQFAIRHPDRTLALVLGSAHFPQKLLKFPAPTFRMAYTDRVFWGLWAFAPNILARIMGVPKTLRPTPAEWQTVMTVMESLFPISPKREGAIFDSLVSNPAVDEIPLEELAIPTLIVHAADDRLAPYETAPPAAARVPGATLLTIDRGGHLLLGAERRVREEVARFVRSPMLMAPQRLLSLSGTRLGADLADHARDGRNHGASTRLLPLRS
jgi:pimeloyl-ACP methyl ester carboxylesterase